jgi:2-phospho-L-lactate guanylyltransferase (CobY/MobA/RfbA family)
MDPGNLRKSLTKLHEELGRARQVDPDSRKLLLQLLSDIERLVHGSAAAAPAVTPDTAHRHRLKEFEVKFEADHPALATTLREFIDALAKMGL